MTLLVLLLPLHQKFIPPTIIILVLFSLFSNFNIHNVYQNKLSICFIFLYLLYLCGMFYTNDVQNGWFNLQVKLSLIILPFALSPCVNLTKKQINWVYTFFIIGCVIAAIICLVISGLRYNEEIYLKKHNLYNLGIGINFFLSSRLSFFMHPSYFSLYICFALSLLLFCKTYFSNKKVLGSGIATLFFVAIVLLSSIAGILILSIIILVFLIKLRSIIYTLLILSLSAGAFTSVYYSAPEFARKFEDFAFALKAKPIQESTTESSTARVLIWQSSLETVMQNPVIGFGTGDVTKALNAKYAEKNYKGLLQNKLNAHNQFLQTTLALGFIGVLGLLVLLFFGLKYFIKNKSLLGILLIFILVLNFMVESMLETQAGVVFFSFWLLFESYKGKNTIEA